MAQQIKITQTSNADMNIGVPKNLTAVEWLIEQLEGDDSHIARVIGLKKYNKIIKEAKQMEKEQIEESWIEGVQFPFIRKK
jgi:GTP-dependent phosphoenolpyruvate carboxykinase